MKRLQDIIVRPLTTEKTAEKAEAENSYAFEVGLGATKVEIKEAVQGLFDVRVSHVRTVVVQGKTKRFGRYYGKRSNWKKAYVTLAEGETLSVYAAL